MRNIYILIVKKRWYLLLLLSLITISMNLFLWNEGSQFIRAYPSLEIMKYEAQQNSYESVYTPMTGGDGEIIVPSQKDRKQLYTLFVEYFLTSHLKGTLYYNKQEYLKKGSLLPVSEKKLNESLLGQELDGLFLDDLIIQNRDYIKLQKFLLDAKEIGFPLLLRSFQETYQLQSQYYIQNLIFGITVSFLFFFVGILLVRFLILESVKICKEEIKVLRILGMSVKKLQESFRYFFTLPIIVGFITFVIFAQSLKVGMIAIDYIYLSCVTLVLLALSTFISNYYLKEFLND